MRKVFVIGIGAGSPDHLTLEAVRALNAVDVFVLPDKGEDKGDLKLARRDILARHVRRAYRVAEIAIPERERAPDDYRATVGDWHRDIALAYGKAFATLSADENAGLLVWGDPSLYDSTLRILDRLRADGAAFEVDVVPGISAVQALCARHGIPLNGIGEPVLLTTGRRLGARLPSDVGSVVVMLDGEQAFAKLDDDDATIFWGAYVGTEDEILIAGRLGDIRGEILSARAAARARKGWIMDIYLLKPQPR